jgi:hypothetical protein
MTRLLQIACYDEIDPWVWDLAFERPLWMLLGVFLVGTVVTQWARGPRRMYWED